MKANRNEHFVLILRTHVRIATGTPTPRPNRIRGSFVFIDAITERVEELEDVAVDEEVPEEDSAGSRVREALSLLAERRMARSAGVQLANCGGVLKLRIAPKTLAFIGSE